MAPSNIAAARMSELVGEEIGVSDWIEISQAMIDQFADATMDHQFIHIDPERARETPFGGTIAHGFLLLSLLSWMSFQSLPTIENVAMTVNYGLNRVRFLTPVRAGARLRGRFLLRAVEEKADRGLLRTFDVTVEIDGGIKPALVAQWLALAVNSPVQP